MEIIYHFDFKAAFKSRGLRVGAVLMFAIFSTFKWDLHMRMISIYLVKIRLESMSVALSGIDNNLEFRVYNEDNSRYKIYMDRIGYAFEYMNLKDKDAAYEIAKMAAEGGGRIE